MTLSEVHSNQLIRQVSSELGTRRQVNAVTQDEESGKTKERQQREVPLPIQDQVTLSKEAQTLAASNNSGNTSKAFQQSPSPFDR